MTGHKNLVQLQLRDTPYEEYLHGDFPGDWEQFFIMLEGLDFVIVAWAESMVPFGLKEQADELSKDLYHENLATRFAVYSFLDDNDDSVSYTKVMKHFGDLTNAYINLAKSYAKTPIISSWYLNLPLRVSGSFNAIRNSERMKATMGGN